MLVCQSVAELLYMNHKYILTIKDSLSKTFLDHEFHEPLTFAVVCQQRLLARRVILGTLKICKPHHIGHSGQ